MEVIFPYSPIKIRCQSGPFWPFNHPANRIGSAPSFSPDPTSPPVTQPAPNAIAPLPPTPPQNRPGTYLFSPTSGGVLISPITPYSGRREASEAQEII